MSTLLAWTAMVAFFVAPSKEAVVLRENGMFTRDHLRVRGAAYALVVQQVFFGDGFSYERAFIEEYVRNQIGSDPITIKTQVPSPRYDQTYVRNLCTLAGMDVHTPHLHGPPALIHKCACARMCVRACMRACRCLWYFLIPSRCVLTFWLPRTQAMVYAIMIPNHNLKQAIESWQQHMRNLRKSQEAAGTDLPSA